MTDQLSDRRPGRPLPQPRGEEKLYFADLLEHRMPFYRCRGCERVYARPRGFCPECDGSVEREWSSGRGVIYSLTTVHRPGHPWFADKAPYSIALVDFAEGFRGLADVTAPAFAEEPFIGQRVRIEFEDVRDDLALVHFVAEARS